VKTYNTNNPIQTARETLRDAFENDPDFRYGWESNIAMLLYDRHGGDFKDYDIRNDTAKALMKLLFWS
jgi:hypothetical protein